MAKPISRIVRFSGVVLLGLLALISVTQLLFSAFHDRLSLTLYFAEWWAIIWANLAVVCFATPAFSRSRDRSWLYVACAASIFVGANVVDMVSMLMRRDAPAYWVYVIVPIGDIVGMLLYASGLVSLARRTKLIDARQPSNQSLEPTARRRDVDI